MKDTIKPNVCYWIGKSKQLGENERVLLDGQQKIMICVLASLEEYEYNKRENECFEKMEVFTTQKGNQFIYWRDNEIDVDYITKVGVV